MDEYTELDSEQIKSDLQGHKDRLRWLMWISFFNLSFLVLEFVVCLIIVMVVFSCCSGVKTTFEQEKRELKSFIKLYLLLN